VRDAEGRPVKRRAMVEAGAALEIEFADGRVNVREAGGHAAPFSKAKPKPQAGQGDLF
jgi:exodeoxyribonuclease VII large subunit